MSRVSRLRAHFLAPTLFAVLSPLAHAQQPQHAQDRVRLFSSEKTNIPNTAALSPDGKWVVLSTMESPAVASLSVIRAETGDAQQLTSAGRWDFNPEWSASGDMIYFISNRPAQGGDQNYYGMSLAFDPSTGRATGEPRQTTTDPVNGFTRISPDGRTLAYVDGRDRSLLKVVPVAGGAARLVTRIPPRSGNVMWSRDGQHLYFVTNIPDQSHRILHSVPVAGGAITAVSSGIPLGRIVVGPGAETFIVEENADGPRDRMLRLVDRRGTVLKTITTNRNTRGTHLTPDGRSLIAIEANIVAPTRIMAIDGGAHRDVTPPVTYDWVMGWSTDGSTLYTWTESNGAPVLAAVPVSGGALKLYPGSEGWSSQGGNNRYLFEATRRDGTKPRSLSAVDLRDGKRHTISESLPGHNMIFPYEPGGTWATQDELYFFERRGDRLDVKAWRGPGHVRTLRSFPASLLGRTNVAVHRGRLVWQQDRGDSADLMIADGNGQPRRLLSMPAAMAGTNEISFSTDGRLLAMHYTRGPGSPDLIAFVDPAGIAPPQIVETGLSYWYWPRWMPDNSGVLVVGGGVGAEAHIVRIPVQAGAQPVNITRSDPASKWGFEVSPDGRFIAYPGEISKGSSVWRIDLSQRR